MNFRLNTTLDLLRMVPCGALLLFSLLRFVLADVDVEEILNPTQRCVASDTQTGACHACVCTADGLYHCRELPCDEDAAETTDPSEQECEPFHTYRQNTVICSCDGTGRWRSSTCRARFHQLQSKTNHHAFKIRTNIECIPEHFYIIDCNICKCHDTGFINLELCTHRPCPRGNKVDNCNLGDVIRTTNEICACSDINYYIDRLCLKVQNKIIQEVNADDLNSIIDNAKDWDDLKMHCQPYKLYNIDCRKCVCNTNGEITCENDENTEKNCKTPAQHDIGEPRLRSQMRFRLHSMLPQLQTLETKCRPGVKYRYKCNTCVCNNRMEPVCTSMICLDDIKMTIHDLRQMVNQN